MPKSKEYVSTDDDSSDEEMKPKKKQKREIEDKEEKVSKKLKNESNKDESNKDTVWDLGNNRQISVRDFKGKLYVDIREMYYDKEANLKPGKKGICLNVTQWKKLLNVMDDVDKAVKSKS
ncbi:activated RNA polymerase II transcriptional coactivator p15 [Apis laboriosa]|uniref:activated RNA polymerase II transcriptional coactivator p15 n=1 Tax=Apis dorsata TaxID=7462 RepID=UPI0003DF5EE9|nr:activated RNA polymerase II transcriptional coactivator p15 [Apis dorsata]XP_006611764.1 activated RNA polymerase II transcriptional coactivator p15 [Apis dorsata]XP_031364491.1 activated RNA polymerase II transcriptional coactivator p15 [Apis dorsata]XP_043802057.1 activated RNA polymerase II transcriptional coactivator p15 [Apis laboriosa]XP_043802058.1 activated RNA polymerase II transcriptional coactivator p15 [Apis laboriosa]